MPEMTLAEAQLVPHTLLTEPEEVNLGEDLALWVTEKSGAGRAWLLAHATDGVIWGRVVEGTLATAPRQSASPWPPLRWATLLDLRIFCAESGELRVWRSGDGDLRAVRVREVRGDQFAARLDRSYLLLGESVQPALGEGFERRASRGGDEHAVPRGASRLLVRHSFEREAESGLLREAEHRWLALLGSNNESILESP